RPTCQPIRLSRRRPQPLLNPLPGPPRQSAMTPHRKPSRRLPPNSQHLSLWTPPEAHWLRRTVSTKPKPPPKVLQPLPMQPLAHPPRRFVQPPPLLIPTITRALSHEHRLNS